MAQRMEKHCQIGIARVVGRRALWSGQTAIADGRCFQISTLKRRFERAHKRKTKSQGVPGKAELSAASCLVQELTDVAAHTASFREYKTRSVESQPPKPPALARYGS
jgi:hypothetical protein